MIRENMWKVSANDVIFHGCFWVPVPVPSTCWLRQSLLCGSWCRMCVRHLQLVYNWIVVQITKKNRDVAHICCLGTIRRNKKHLGLLFGLLLAIRLSNLAVKTYLWFVSPFILSGMFRCRAVWGSTILALTSCKPIPQHDYNFCPGKTALNCGPQSETTQNAAPKNFKTAVYDGVYHVLPPYTSLCRVHIYVYRIYIYVSTWYIYISTYIYIHSTWFTTLCKALGSHEARRRSRAFGAWPPPNGECGLGAKFFSIRRAKIGQLRVELIHDDVHFSIHIYSIYI